MSRGGHRVARARALLDRGHGLAEAAALTGFAALVYAPAAFLNLPRREPSVSVLLALAGLGVICTACAFIVFLELIKEVGTSRANRQVGVETCDGA
jgi:drug/metabolite transporter (DMT)-like permease